MYSAVINKNLTGIYKGVYKQVKKLYYRHISTTGYRFGVGIVVQCKHQVLPN